MEKTRKSESEETKVAAIEEETKIDEANIIAPQADEQIVTPIDEAKIEKTTEEVSIWKPITDLGKKVKAGEITDLNVIFDKGLKIKESQIVDMLLDNPQSDLLNIGQSKGKFGGGKRKAFRQTQKKTKEGNKPKFATYAVIGNKNGFIGIGYGKTKETVPAREKALRNAKLNIIRIVRGCGSWQCGCKTPHSIPFKVEGKCGSSTIILRPAPKGTGLKVEVECQKILGLAGIKDIWSKSSGQIRNKINLIKACEDALRKLSQTKVPEHQHAQLGILIGNKVH